MAGLGQLSKPVLDSLKGNLAGQSAPPNPATPTNRKDPSESRLLDYQRVRRALDRAHEQIPDGDPEELLIGAMGACMTRVLSKIDLSDAVDVLLERLFPLSSPQLKAKLQAMYAPISPPTGLGGGAPGGGPPPSGQSAAGGATGSPPGGGATSGPPMPGEAGVATLPA
jgi:hypothetical protein